MPSGQSIACSLTALNQMPGTRDQRKPGIIQKFCCLPLYGAKYPDISRISWTACDPKALTAPFVVGTIAMFDVIAPSIAFNVETSGCVVP